MSEKLPPLAEAILFSLVTNPASYSTIQKGVLQQIGSTSKFQ